LSLRRNGADRLAQIRDQLTLDFALVNEQKTAKVVALSEELRRDHPRLPTATTGKLKQWRNRPIQNRC
jgi:hypothetical protein